MKHSFLTLLLLVITTVTAVASAGPVSDISLGKVTMHDSTKLDGKARSDVLTVAAKIKKMRSAGVIKVRGDFPAAETAAEYLSQSVFMAREVALYLQTLLSTRFQVFVTATAYSGAKRSAVNSVEILLYPLKLSLEEKESLRFVSTRIASRPTPAQPETPIETVGQPAAVPDGGLLSAPHEEAVVSDSVSTKREREKRTSEDAALANELVLKAKARAAEKAKRRAAGN